MTDDHINVGATAILDFLGLVEEGKEWRSVYYVVRYSRWFILVFVAGLFLLSPELIIRGLWVYRWLLFYQGYLFILEGIRRFGRNFYDTFLFRIVRIQVEVVFTSFLLLETGGAESPLWFIYLSPLFTSALYFRWNGAWGIYGEISVLYCSVSLVEAGSFSRANLSLCLTNLSVLLVLIVALRYLVEIIKRYEAVEQKVSRLQMIQHLNEVGQSLTTLQESPEVLQRTLKRIADAAMLVLEADLVDLYQYQADENKFILPPIMVGKRRFPHLVPELIFSDDVVVKVVQIGDKIYASDAQGHPVLVAAWEDHDKKQSQERFVVREKIVSSAAIPLKFGEEVLGVMFVNYRQEHDFDTEFELRQRIETFASFAGIAIQNARLLERERTLREALGGAIKLEEVAEKILDELSKVIQYRKVSLQLIQGDARTLLAGRGFDIKNINPWFQRPVSKNPLVSRIVTSQEPLILSETSNDPDWGIFPGTADIKSWVGLPLVYDRETIGLLTLEHDQPGFYTQDIRDLLAPFVNQAAIDLQKAYLLDRAKRRILDLEIINKVGQIMSTKVDTQNLLNTIVSQLADQLHSPRCTLFLPQKVSDKVLLVPEVTLHSERDKIRRFKSGEGLVGWVFQQGESLVLDDVSRDSRFVPTEGRQPRSMLVAPIKVGERTIGVISADHDEVGWFSEGDRHLVDTLTRQAGIAIERATALELLQEVGSRIISAQEVGEILHRIVSGAVELTNTTTGAIYLISRDGRVVDQFQTADFDHPSPRMEKEDGLTRQVIATGEVIIIPDIRTDPRVNPVLHEHYRSMIVVPLKFEQKVIGALFLDDKDSHDFTETEISVLLTLASQAAIAIENARLYSELDRRVQERTAELQKANEELKELDRIKTKFLSTVSHELRTPLTPVKIYIENFLDEQYGEINEKQRDRFKRALNRINEEVELIENLLDLVRIQAGEIKLEPSFENITKIVYDVVQAFEYTAARKHIDLRTIFPENAVPEIQLDRLKVKQVISNLIRNAIKFTPERGTITVKVSSNDKQITIQVIDTGIGIPEEALPKIFDRFYQVDSSDSRKEGGTGIGLNITKEFIELHDGKIWAESIVGEGTIFTFTLPKIKRG